MHDLSAEARERARSEDFAEAAILVKKLRDLPGGRDTADALRNELDALRAAADGRAQARQEQQARAVAIQREQEARERAQQIDQLLHHARMLIDANQFDAALEGIDRVLVLDPRNRTAVSLRRLANERRSERSAILQASAASPGTEAQHPQTVLRSTDTMPVPAARPLLSREPAGKVKTTAVKRKRWLSVVAGAVVPLTIVVAAFIWVRRPTPSPDAQVPSVPTSPVTLAPPSQPQPPAEAPVGSNSSSPTVAPPTSDTPDPLEILRRRLQAQLKAGDRDQILATLVSGLAINNGDAEFSRELNDLYQEAAAKAGAAQTAADQVNARRFATGLYEEAQRSLGEARRMATGRRGDAIRAYWIAANTFDRASVAAQEQARVLTQITPPVQTPPPPERGPEPPPPIPSPLPGNPLPTRVPSPDLQRADRDAVDRVLSEYEAAWSALDANAVRRVHPGASNDLNRTLGLFKSLVMQLQNRQITIDGDTATVVCERVMNEVMKRANLKTQASNQVVIQLQRNGTTWTVQTVTQR
jgi:tetratricopeptide (TPR) repeat protein